MRYWHLEKATQADFENKVIASIVELTDGSSRFDVKFTDGTAVFLVDEPDCCAHKYITIEPGDLAWLVGKTVLSVDVTEEGSACRETDYGDVSEIQFLEFRTTDGVVFFSCHNDHNGYYGGISLDMYKQSPAGVES